MILGTVEIDAANQLLHTHNATFRLDVLKVAKAPRVYLSSAGLLGAVLALFGGSFHDILWPGELAAIALGCCFALGFGWNFTRLSFHSRDLSGAAVSGALFGTHGHLNRIRREVMATQAMTQTSQGDRS